MPASLTGLYDRFYGCLVGGLIGDAMGAKAEDLSYQEIERQYGKIVDVPEHPGTDDSRLKHMLCKAIIRSGGYPGPEEFAEVWREDMTPANFYYPVANAYYKVFVQGVPPRQAGRGNMISNSSAMCIAPIGLINAGHPRGAAREALHVTQLIHDGLGQEAAAAVAAAVARAATPGTTVDAVIEASWSYLGRGSEIEPYLRETLEMARRAAGYEAFRSAFYATRLQPWPGLRPDQNTAIDPRETVPVALAIFALSGGDFESTVVGCVNFGRDADTIGTIGGAIAGAFCGGSRIRPEWRGAVEKVTPVDQRKLADELLGALQRRHEELRAMLAVVGRASA